MSKTKSVAKIGGRKIRRPPNPLQLHEPTAADYPPPARTPHVLVVKEPPTQTERAIAAFLSHVAVIPGVLGWKRSQSGAQALPLVYVVVPALRTETSGQVFDLEGDVARTYPDARMQVRVIGLKERGVAEAEWTSVLPE